MRRPFRSLLSLTTAAALLSVPVSTTAAQAPRPSTANPSARAEEPSREMAARLIGGALSNGLALERLEELTDTIGPRLSGTPAYDAAVRWAAQKLKQDGLEVRLEKVMVPRWVRGVERGEVLATEAYTSHPLAITTLGGSVPTPEGGLTAEVVEVRSFEELLALGEKARGKIVLFTHTMGTKGGYGDFAGLRYRGVVAAARAGAAAMLIRSLATASLRSPHTGSFAYEDGVPRIPAAAISTEDADLIHRLLARGPVRLRLEIGCKVLPDAEAANVVADLRGRERPEEVVLISAHLDSWDLGTGALDDGAGVVIVMEAARQIAKLPKRPRRTLRVVLFANEENGLRGATGYATAHASELPRHVAALESDSGAGKPLGIRVLAGEGGAALVKSWMAPLATLGLTEVTLSTEPLGADLIPLRGAQVPMVGVHQDSTRYFEVHHSAADTFDKVNPRELAENAAVVTWLAYALAESPRVLPRPAAPQAAPPPVPVQPAPGAVAPAR